jgi:dTDP-4-dehydrorhamnose reductase
VLNQVDSNSTINKYPVSRVLIIGASGYIGSSLALGLREEYEVFGTYYSNPVHVEGVTSFLLDSLKSGMIFDIIKRIEPDIVFYCVGPSPEMNAEEAESLLVKAPSLFFKLPSKPFYFVYFSPDQVINGDFDAGTLHDETVTSGASNHYTQLKIQAESLMMSQSRLTYLFRIGSLFGEKMGAGPCFRDTFLQSLLRAFRMGVTLPVTNQHLRTYLYIGDLLRAIRLFIKKVPENSQVFHLACPDAISPYEFSVLIANKCKIKTSKIKAVSHMELPDAARHVSRNCALSSKKFEEFYEFKVARTVDAITELYDRLYSGKTGSWI